MLNTLKILVKYLPVVALCILIAVASFLIGRYMFPFVGGPKEKLDTHAIFEEIVEQGTIVTHSVMINQKVVRTVDQGSEWSNFWWGHEVTAEALLRVQIGISMEGLKESDIVIDQTMKTICVKYPDPKIIAITTESPIDVSTKSGLLKRLVASDTNSDFNNALTDLKAEAQRSVENSVIMQETGDSADKVLGYVLLPTGYSLINSCRAK